MDVVNSGGERDVRSVAALAEPVRRQLYEIVAGSSEPVSREQAAAAADVPLHTAKFHLDKLVDEGLVDIEFRRLSGRTGPGSGRPSKMYRRAERDIAVSLPARQYDLLSWILANAVAESVTCGEPVTDVASRIAHTAGIDLGKAQGPSESSDLQRVEVALASTGYEPRYDGAEVLELRNCPFHKVAAEQTELVCGLNLDFVTGVCQGLDVEGVRPKLDPEMHRCCVTISSCASVNSEDVGDPGPFA